MFVVCPHDSTATGIEEHTAKPEGSKITGVGGHPCDEVESDTVIISVRYLACASFLEPLFRADPQLKKTHPLEFGHVFLVARVKTHSLITVTLTRKGNTKTLTPKAARRGGCSTIRCANVREEARGHVSSLPRFSELQVNGARMTAQ